MKVINLKLESWSAIAPGMEDTDAWSQWLQQNRHISPVADSKPSLKQVPPLIRRRFTSLGKYAARAAFDLLEHETCLPKVFASRHGDTALTLSLLEEIAQHESVSPTGFSLAVHNAVAGLISIARQDDASITAIASMEGMLLSTFHEAIAQLQDYPRVLCIIYDAPLPELYQAYAQSASFPYAVGFILSRDSSVGVDINIERIDNNAESSSETDEVIDFVSLLLGLSSNMFLSHQKQNWRLGVKHAP